MEESIPIEDSSLRPIELEYEGQKFKCKFQVNDESINISIFLINSLIYKGKISLENIRSQICIFSDYTTSEIFKEIMLLNSENFSIIEDFNKYKLKIQFLILRKERDLLIDLNKNKDITLPNNDLINHYENIIKEKDKTISELKEMIKFKDEKIKTLEDKLNNIKKESTTNKNTIKQNYQLFEDFNIKSKNPIHILKNHTDIVNCLALLNDGRLVSGSNDKTIIIYNKNTYQPDIIIEEHNDGVNCITQMSSGILVSCSNDKTIKLFKIKEKDYETLQILKDHTDRVYKVIELRNKYLVSCSSDASIKFYIKDNYKFKNDYQISTNESCSSIIQTKENEICYSESKNKAICFFDLNEKKIKSTIKNISKNNDGYEWFIMITEELLLIPGNGKISIINVYQYRLIRVIDVTDSNWITGICMLNKNILITGDYKAIIRQWKIIGDDLILISEKENTHDGRIKPLLNMEDGHFVTGSDDTIIKVW